MDSRQQADAAVRLLLARKGKIIFGDIDIELAKQIAQRGESHPAPNEKTNERAQNPRDRRWQASRVRRGYGFGHETNIHDSSWD